MPYIEKLSALCNEYDCELRADEPLCSHTTFRIGGKCRALVEISSAEALKKISAYLISENIKYFVLGRGSNVIVSDEGFDGVILLLSKAFSEIRLIGDTDIYCTAGTSLRDVCLMAHENSLEGMEFAFGIPGTCGGALFMNAGAYGGEIKDVVVSAHYLENGEIREIKAEDMDLSYRHSVFAENTDRIITDMVFRLKKGDKAEIRAKMDDFMERRKTKQPLEYPSAGSTFKRPEGSFASLLIEQCGLKGLSVGGAQVSEKHSGFVINKGNATCKDVLELCEKVREIVLDKTGYNLELEPLVLK